MNNLSLSEKFEFLFTGIVFGALVLSLVLVLNSTSSTHPHQCVAMLSTAHVLKNDVKYSLEVRESIVTLIEENCQ